jgi:hypothetical protein
MTHYTDKDIADLHDPMAHCWRGLNQCWAEQKASWGKKEEEPVAGPDKKLIIVHQRALNPEWRNQLQPTG